MKPLSLEEMLESLAKNNDIKEYTFLEYTVVEFYNEIWELDLDEGIIKAEQIEKNQISSYLKEYRKEDSLIGVMSKVLLEDGSTKHLIFMDFDCPPTLENLEDAADFIQNIGFSSGYFYNSGQGFHYYYTKIVNEDMWKKTLLEAKKSELVDKNWIEIQLRRGYSVLRLTSNEEKPCIPTIVKTIGEVLDCPGQLLLFEEPVFSKVN